MRRRERWLTWQQVFPGSNPQGFKENGEALRLSWLVLFGGGALHHGDKVILCACISHVFNLTSAVENVFWLWAQSGTVTILVRLYRLGIMMWHEKNFPWFNPGSLIINVCRWCWAINSSNCSNSWLNLMEWTYTDFENIIMALFVELICGLLHCNMLILFYWN